MANKKISNRCNKILHWSLPCLIAFPTASHSDTLEQAVATALSSSPEVRRAFNSYQAQREQISQAYAGYLPTVDLNAGYGIAETDSPSTRSSGTQNDRLNPGEAGLSIRQALFSGFRTMNEVSRTEAETEAEYWGVISTSEDHALETIRAYIKYIQAERVVSLSRVNLLSHQNIYRQIKEKTDSGLGSSADLSQIMGRLARAKANLAAAENNLLDARASYVKIVNVPPIDLKEPQPKTSLLPENLQQALATAESVHPTLKLAMADVSAARYQYETSKSTYYPEVSLELNSNWDNDISGSLGHNNDIQAMLRMRYNLFNGGRDHAYERETAFRIGESEEIKHRARREVVEGTTLAWNAHVSLQDQVGYLAEHVEASIETQSAYTLQFRLGQRSLLDLLDAENELFDSRKDLEAAQFDQLIAKYRILNATGQLLSSLEIQPEVLEEIERLNNK
ncbi:TolC family outer membrane protein [Grimontia marina]|uniref:Outer membrane efflux protein BepC n=1 Tax=Grimontia marina TaxID=646534 RepID=A0A128FBF7_9GAMM|nr:TolC family outer membrane protein [Grimontia marina]CZF83835.1 Outer membrane efflux protein BepC precursor [Grimontia marina]